MTRIEERGNGTLRILRAQAKALSEPPDFETIGEMEKVLAAMFVTTQVATHVISGSLKASGTRSSDFDGDTWEGQISYGGPLTKAPHPGPVHDPVDYAIYEMNRGGAHDFFRQLPEFDKPFENAFDSHFTRHS